ncbi:MAG: two pore domain potassium channel family protein [Anaerolineales bacterium]|nr:MAG: two pore domain potassium channel family protein [Anaerolineales bacterium]
MTKPSQEDEGLDTMLSRLAGRKAARRRGGPRRRRFVTGRSTQEQRRLVTARRKLAIVVSAALIYSTLDLLRPLGTFALLSAVTVLAAAALLVMPLLEIALGAGHYWEMAYRTSGRQLRKRRFEPSLPRLTDLFTPLGISLVAQLAGFASLHHWMSQAFAGSYSEAMGPVGALYYSVTAFSRGVVDVAPISDGARALTALQSLLGWLEMVVIIATLMAWIQQNQRLRKPSSP